MAQISPDKAQYCVRCGAYEYWEVLKLDRTDHDDEGDILVYNIVCTQCGRPDEYMTRDVQAIPERVKIREELMTPEVKFDPKKRYESDMLGFAPDKVKPRLPTGKSE